MALSTTAPSEDYDSRATFGYHNSLSVVHDTVMTRTTSPVAGEFGLDSSFREEGGLNSEVSHESKDAVKSDKAIFKSDTENQEEGDETTRSLPEDVMEKIIARLPFRSIFQSRLLARRWASNILSSGSSETSFRREIMENSLSSTWESYCPIYVGLSRLIGYNLVSKVWENILNLSYLPISDANFRSLKLGNVAGALLPFFATNQYTNNKLHVWVTNPLSRSWKLLHPFSLTRRSKIVLVHLECVSAFRYKLIVITADHILEEGPDLEVFLGAQVYDSSGKCWARYDPCTTRIDWMEVASKWCSALVGDTLYMMGQIVFCEPVLVAYNTKDEIWSRVTIYSPQPSTRFWSEAMLFACGSKIMIVNIRRDSTQVVTIYELDRKCQSTNPCGETDKPLESSNTYWSCSHMTSVQIPLPFTGPVMKIASDEKALYFFVPREGSASCEQPDVRVFDVHMQVWSSLDGGLNATVLPIHMPLHIRERYKWAKSAFQPGLNPFVEV